ncbi:peptidyl-prolyl cis-trans isomerase [Planomicrobium sp. CPCC 101079]|uniref:peptidyl-prolyl cis-trans isomerase n=1 Tax=Planomicrobium sp. CPCC 101079 TaxID=2599618 RepID=UPI0011B59590|nr:peptidyl-prolyl cis-trans isomerase [Planomicrobium sp. CPCC 101079]TWT06235.1 foldase [Planomicrobium sp. CPCC 101079]
MSFNHNRNRPPSLPADGGRPRRRLKTKPLLVLLLILFVGNLLWFIAWLIPNQSGGSEEVASVDGEKITRQQWMAAMEELHGRDTLLELVNEKVMETAAKEYNIKVTDKEVDLELAMLRSAQEGIDKTIYSADEDRLRDNLKTQLILEKVLTKDIVIEDKDVEAFYNDNQALYDIKDAYRTRMIVVDSMGEADKAISELENGTSFEALAKERSVDTATGSLGGDIGYITQDQTTVDPKIAQTVTTIDVDSWSEPLELSDGRIAILSVTEKAEGQTFSYNDVKEHVSRELALEQLPQSVTPEAFWREFDAKWFYGE